MVDSVILHPNTRSCETGRAYVIVAKNTLWKFDNQYHLDTGFFHYVEVGCYYQNQSKSSNFYVYPIGKIDQAHLRRHRPDLFIYSKDIK